MKQKRVRRLLYELLILILVLLLLGAVLFQAGYALMPERSIYGSTWPFFLREQENSVDVLILGSSRVYCNVIPSRIYARTGVTSYIMAGPSQSPDLTYFYLRECLRTQRPKYVFMEVSGAFFGDPGSDAKPNVCYMPFSINRIRAAQCCRETDLKLALFPLEEFHYRIYDENKPQSNYDGELLCGYTPLSEANPQPEERIPRTHSALPGSERWDTNLSYLHKIARLCREEGIPCFFFLCPTRQYYDPDAVDLLRKELLAEPGVTFENWMYLDDALGIDPQTQWHDSLHFNTSGAEIFTDHLSGYIRQLGLPPTDGEDEDLWQRRVSYPLP